MKTRYNVEEACRRAPGYLPPDRRRCLNCHKVMRPIIQYRTAQEGEPGRKRFRETVVVEYVRWYGYGPENCFCTLRCGYAFACRRIKEQRP